MNELKMIMKPVGVSEELYNIKVAMLSDIRKAQESIQTNISKIMFELLRSKNG